MATNNPLVLEGQSITGPPIFNGINYVSWKECIKIFFQYIDIELWYIVNESPYETTNLDADLGKFRPKVRSELDTQDKANYTLNAKAMNVIYDALNANESSRVKGCKSAKEI